MENKYIQIPESYPELINRRLQQTRFTIEDEKLDALVISHIPNVRYLTNFSGVSAFLFVTQDELHFVTDDRYELQVQRELYKLPNMKIHITRDVWQYLADTKFLGKISSLGFEADRMPYSDAVEVRNVIRPMKFKPAPNSFEPFTMPKDKDELIFIEKAANIALDTFKYITDFMKPGMTEVEIENEIAYYARKIGSEGVPFHIVFSSGINTAYPHLKATEKKIKKNEIIMVDFGCTYNGFAAGITRTLVIGKATKEQKAIYSMIYKAQQAAFKNLRPGMNGKILDGFAREIIEKEGYGDYFKTNLGHGVGISYNEKPIISFREDSQMVPEGCVLAIEPGVYIPEKFGIRIKDNVVVSRNGTKHITESPKEIIQI